MEADLSAEFQSERDALAESLRNKGLIFERMASYIAEATTPEQLAARSEDCQRSPGMFGGGMDDA